MAVMDEFKEERARMKEQPFKVRLAHFWHYYKWHVIVIAAALFFIGDYAYQLITAKDVVLQVGMLDCYSNTKDNEPYVQQIEELLAIDTKKEEVFLDNNYLITMESEYTTLEILYVRLAAQELDVIMANEDIFNDYSLNDIYVDLRTVLSPEQLDYYEDSFYYIDYDLIENEDLYAVDETLKPLEDLSNHRSPEGMKKPIPVGIYVTGNEEFHQNYMFAGDTQEAVFGLAFYAEHPEYALQFLDFISGRTDQN